MKKIVLIPTLLTVSLLFAKPLVEVTPQVGYNFAGKDTDLKNYAVYGGEVQYNGFNFPIKPELSFYYSLADYEDDYKNFVNNADTNVMRFALNGVYEFDKISIFTPSVKLGAGYETMDSAYGGNNDGSGFGDGGLAVKVPFSDMFSFKLEGIYMLKYNAGRYDNNYLLLGGLNVALGSTGKEVVTNYDIDNDGVEDSQDSCLNTPANTEVDEYGCKIETSQDSDKDGIIDSLDSCLDTPLNVAVDHDGCALPQDSDNDGVIDSKDECANTPAGTEVEMNGCEVEEIIKDSDSDGVLDNVDACPNTPMDLKVDERGCKVVDLEAEFKKLTIRFGYKYTELVAPESQENIAKLVKILEENPSIKVKILGYTDSIASKEYNLKLSQKRANKVKKILVDKGISEDRLIAIGMGEANPIATNMYKAGRAQNRRIEVELVK